MISVPEVTDSHVQARTEKILKLNARFSTLSSILSSPGVYLADHFDTLINKIDIEFIRIEMARRDYFSSLASELSRLDTRLAVRGHFSKYVEKIMQENSNRYPGKILLARSSFSILPSCVVNIEKQSLHHTITRSNDTSDSIEEIYKSAHQTIVKELQAIKQICYSNLSDESVDTSALTDEKLSNIAKLISALSANKSDYQAFLSDYHTIDATISTEIASINRRLLTRADKSFSSLVDHESFLRIDHPFFRYSYGFPVFCGTSRILETYREFASFESKILCQCKYYSTRMCILKAADTCLHIPFRPFARLLNLILSRNIFGFVLIVDENPFEEDPISTDEEFTYKKLIQLLCLNQIAEALPSSSTITPIVKVVVSIHSVKNIISTSKGLTLSALPLTALAENLFEAFEDLRELRLSNKLTSLTHRHFMSLSSLRTLIIEHFDSDQEHTRQHSLETPRLSLGDKVFETLVNLETLRIVGCGLVTIAENLFEGPRNLQTLYLCSNKIGPSLPLKQFNSLKQLESLCLHDNQIEKLEFEAFTGLPHLRRLGLRNNEISPVDALDLLVKNKISTHKLMTDQCNRWCL